MGKASGRKKEPNIPKMQGGEGGIGENHEKQSTEDGRSPEVTSVKREGPASARSKETDSDKRKVRDKEQVPGNSKHELEDKFGKTPEPGTKRRGRHRSERKTRAGARQRGPSPYSRGSGTLPRAFDRGRAGGAHGRQHGEGKVPTKSRRCGFQELPPTPAPRTKVLNTAGARGDRA